jgi:hypothetical protein
MKAKFLLSFLEKQPRRRGSESTGRDLLVICGNLLSMKRDVFRSWPSGLRWILAWWKGQISTVYQLAQNINISFKSLYKSIQSQDGIPQTIRPYSPPCVSQIAFKLTPFFSIGFCFQMADGEILHFRSQLRRAICCWLYFQLCKIIQNVRTKREDKTIVMFSTKFLFWEQQVSVWEQPRG